jgi:uncharacterized protein
MHFGLKEQTIESIIDVFARHPGVEKAMLYGSRAMGNFKPGSDIDLTLLGASLTSLELDAIDEELDELMLPYQIDLSLFHRIENRELCRHIERVGIVLYRKLVP